ncbi:MAG: PilN domain-containing protein [bacterium]|nr:PilN domain-containing protein [bacterium]
MQEVDFIPEWYQAKRRGRRDLVLRGILLGSLVLVLAFTSVAGYARAAAAKQDLAQLESSLAGQAGVIQATSALEEQLAKLRRRRQLLSDIAGGAPLHGVLAELSRIMPEAMALTELRFVRERFVAEGQPAEPSPRKGAERAATTPGGRIELVGLAATDAEVASLMSNMLRAEVFGIVRLGYSRAVVSDGLLAREFKLFADLRQFE